MHQNVFLAAPAAVALSGLIAGRHYFDMVLRSLLDIPCLQFCPAAHMLGPGSQPPAWFWSHLSATCVFFSGMLAFHSTLGFAGAVCFVTCIPSWHQCRSL